MYYNRDIIHGTCCVEGNYKMMSSILFTKARFAFLTELFDILQYIAVAVTIPSIVPIIKVFFIVYLLLLLFAIILAVTLINLQVSKKKVHY